MQEMQVRSLGQEDHLEKEMTTHSIKGELGIALESLQGKIDLI